MSTTDFSLEGIEQQPLEIFTEKAYLEYSMYVILDRAIPHIGDGLKPDQMNACKHIFQKSILIQLVKF